MKKFITLREMTFTAILAALTCIISPFSITIPFSQVPITLGVLAVFVSGILLTPKLAFLSQAIYILIGIAGLPVFSKFGSGVAVISGPTGGYLITYPIMALVVALSVKLSIKLLKEKPLPLRIIIISLGMIAALLICYACGTLRLAQVMDISFGQALASAVIPFIPFDIGKATIAIAVFLPIRARLWNIMNLNASKNTA